MAEIYVSQLRLANSERKNPGRILCAILVPIPFIAVGLAMLFSGIGSQNITTGIIGFLITVFGGWLSYTLIKKAATPIFQVYKLFEQNDVFVDADGGFRYTEVLASEQFNGELKPALRFVAESPDLRRRERMEHISQWYDYEKDYIRDYYGKDPLAVAQTSMTDALTRTILKKEGCPMDEENRFEIIKASCTNKTQPSYLADGDEDYMLHFGNYGTFVCSNALYRSTNTGEVFFVIRGSASGKIYMAFSTLDWHLDDDLSDLLQ